MALRVSSKNCENLYVTGYFSCYGEKIRFKYIVLKNIGCLLENYAREKIISPENFLAFCQRNLNFNPRKCPSAREKTSKNSEKMPSRTLFIFSGKKKHCNSSHRFLNTNLWLLRDVDPAAIGRTLSMSPRT